MNLSTTGQWIVWTAGVLGGWAVIWRFVVRPALRGIHETVDLLRWLHDQFEARDGNGVKVREEITDTLQRLEALQAQVEVLKRRIPEENT
jgi:hypothetical protein